MNTELSGGHKLHRAPQVASDERRVRLAEGPEIKADDANAPQPQRRGAHLLVLRLGGVPQREEPSARTQQVEAAQPGRASHRVGDDVELSRVDVVEVLSQPGLVIAQVQDLLALGLAAGDADDAARTEQPGHLTHLRSEAAGGGVDQHALAAAQLGDLLQGDERRRRVGRNCGGQDRIESRGERYDELRGGHGDLPVAATSGDGQGDDGVPNPVVIHPVPKSTDSTTHLQPGSPGQVDGHEALGEERLDVADAGMVHIHGDLTRSRLRGGSLLVPQPGRRAIEVDDLHGLHEQHLPVSVANTISDT